MCASVDLSWWPALLLLRWLLGLRDLDDDIAMSGQAQFVAGNGLDFVGIGLQRFYLAGKLGVFFIQASDFALDALDFQLGVTHGQKSVRAEYIVKKKSENKQNHYGAPVLGPESCEYGLSRHVIDFKS
jgi:hypothetical protein